MITSTAQSLSAFCKEASGLDPDDVEYESSGGGTWRTLGDLAAVGVGGGIVKGQINRGNLTGRDRYHYGVGNQTKADIYKNGIHPTSLKGLPETTILSKRRMPAYVASVAQKVDLDNLSIGDLKKSKVKTLGYLYNLLTGKESVQVNVPPNKFKTMQSLSDTADDIASEYLEAGGIKPPKGEISGFIKRLIGDVRTVDEHIPPEYIKGSPQYKRPGWSEIKDYMKNNKLRTAGGLAVSGAGTALAGYGIYDMINRYLKHGEENADE